MIVKKFLVATSRALATASALELIGDRHAANRPSALVGSEAERGAIG